MSYTQVDAGVYHTVLLRSDGCAVACGSNTSGQCNIPPVDEDIFYTQVSAGLGHTVLLRSDGRAVACGSNAHGRCNIPPLDAGVSYMQVSAGNVHTLLLQSDGGAVACGRNGSNGTCNIPPLDEGVWYTQVSAGVSHSLLLLCDGSAVAFGDNHFRECNLPSLEPGTFYLSDTDMLSGRDRVLQLDLISDDAIAVTCSDLAGEEVVCLNAGVSDLAWNNPWVPSESSTGPARRTVVGVSLPRKSRDHRCECIWTAQASSSHIVSERTKCVPRLRCSQKKSWWILFTVPVSQSCIVYDMHPTWQLLETGGLPMVCQAGRCSCGIMSIATRNLRIVVLICRLLWLQSELVKVMFHQSWLELFAGDQDDPHDRRGYINDK